MKFLKAKMFGLIHIYTRCIAFTLFCVFFNFINLYAQEVPSHENPDTLFIRARELAFSGNLESAHEICKKILEDFPEYDEVRIFNARVFAWQRNFEKARKELAPVLKKDYKNKEAIGAKIDFEIWATSYLDALANVDSALNEYPIEGLFLIKKIKILILLERAKEAYSVLAILRKVNPNNVEIPMLENELALLLRNHTMGVNVSLDAFSKIYSEIYFVSIQYFLKTKFGVINPKVNYINRFNLNGLQAEVDLYPKISRNFSGYLNLGYSDHLLFPNYRVGADVYAKINKNLESGLGVRYLMINETNRIKIYTGTFSYYVRSYRFLFQPFFTPSASGLSQAFNFSFRKYGSNEESFYSVQVGGGFSPDQRQIQSLLGFNGKEIFYLKSQRIGLFFQKNIGARLIILGGLDYIRQEIPFVNGNYVFQYSAHFGSRVKF